MKSVWFHVVAAAILAAVLVAAMGRANEYYRQCEIERRV